MQGVPIQRIAIFVCAAVVVLGVGAWGLLAADGPSEGAEVVLEPAGEGGALLPGSAGAQGEGLNPVSTSTTAGFIYVQVAGCVVRPGVYRLSEGARVFEAIRKAGGTTPDGDEESVPLAAPLQDGARVVVPPRPSVEDASGGSSAGGGSAAGPDAAGSYVEVAGAGSLGGPGNGKISLSHATATELETLPGVGPKTAERIIEYREANGGFATVDELENVSGIGPVTMSEIRELVEP